MPTKLLFQVDSPTYVWQDSGGDRIMSLAGLASNSGQVGQQLDRGAGLLHYHYNCKVIFQLGLSGVIRETMRVYFTGTNELGGVNIPGGLPATDTALGINPDEVINLDAPSGFGIVDKTTTASDIISEFNVEIPWQFVSPVVVAPPSSSLQNTVNVNSITLTPIPPTLE